MGRISKWFPPFTGIIFIALFVAVFVLFEEVPDVSEESAGEIADYYQDNDAREYVLSALIGLAATSILFFAGWLRRLLRDAEGPDGVLSAVAFAGAVVFSAGAAVAASVHFALPDLANDIDPVALQAIAGIDFDMFVFFPVGMGTMVLATGISAVRHGSLPTWFAWASVVLGVLFVSPVFWIVFFVGPLWFLIISIIGIRRALAEGAPATP